jgi:16S rRNA (adenine1518-N6/adenine1519-N6)-dimethyltransferase
MVNESYKSLLKSINASKRLGQNFLVNREVARKEAMYAINRKAIELGPGLGILTEELCTVAKHVKAVELDKRLYGILKAKLDYRNLELINADFFDLPDKEVAGYDIMVSNVPYSASSRVITWLGVHAMPAVLCLQKEFVDHMEANPGSRNYSKLSVISHLLFTVRRMMDVKASEFYPRPSVDSVVIFMKPNNLRIEPKAMEMISLLMEHKKKKIRNAVIDSSKALGIDKPDAASLAELLDTKGVRALHMEPEAILDTARHLASLHKKSQKE